MGKPSDVRVVATRLYFLPILTRVPLKFGAETLTHVTCARACLTVCDSRGRRTEGWGETPLSVQWVWPSPRPYESREALLERFCMRLARAWATFDEGGHPIEISHDFQEHVLPGLLDELNREQGSAAFANALSPSGIKRSAVDPGHTPALSSSDQQQLVPSDPLLAQPEPMPWLAALLCCSVFDQALHDAYGQVLARPVYETYHAAFMHRDLGDFLMPAADQRASFAGTYPADFLNFPRAETLLAWHLVGGLDPLEEADLTGAEPDDGYPVLLQDWIHHDGLKCLKIKLRGNDAAWDFDRLGRVGQIALRTGVEWLSADFNCTVRDPAYVNGILDRLRAGHADVWRRLLYVEQPFPYDLEKHRIDVRSIAARTALFLDESAHDWRLVRLGRELGWTGVALKTCKTQTGALLSACWAKAHGMQLMVQDLTNPMLAQIPHLLLAAHVGTIMGVETNSMQFYPAASLPEAAVHPGVYRRREGRVDLESVRGNGFGYRLGEIKRVLPPAAVEFG